jgi:hypothetical protein
MIKDYLNSRFSVGYLGLSDMISEGGLVRNSKSPSLYGVKRMGTRTARRFFQALGLCRRNIVLKNVAARELYYLSSLHLSCPHVLIYYQGEN